MKHLPSTFSPEWKACDEGNLDPNGRDIMDLSFILSGPFTR